MKQTNMEYWKRLERVINCPKMPSFKFLIFFSSLLVISLLSLSSGNEAAPTYMHHFCSGPGTNFTFTSTFKSNIDRVLFSLSSNAIVTGFSNASAGVVSGLFLCRGDVNATVCQDCVAFGAFDILQRCILQMGAIVWYDECLVRYSNESIFATLNEGPDMYWASTLTMPEAEEGRFNAFVGQDSGFVGGPACLQFFDGKEVLRDRGSGIRQFTAFVTDAVQPRAVHARPDCFRLQ
jgi:hypothetical protein